ncbi:hypothetical protein T439DRAFT_329141 [Meredithblackwellia eburnea MCA 4105]
MKLNLLIPVLVTLATSTYAQTPLLAWTHPPTNFIGAGLSEGFSKQGPPPTVIFIPKLHSCGSLLVVSAPSVSKDALELVAGRDAIKEEWEGSIDKVIEEGANEDHVVAFARGWRNTCGRGDSMREVKVVKLAIEGLDMDGLALDTAVDQLDIAMKTHLDALPSAPHPHSVIITSFSPSALTDLFTIAGSSSPAKDLPGGGSSSGGTTPDGTKWKSETRVRHSPFVRLIAGLIKMGFTVGVLAALAYAGQVAYRKWQERKAGRVMLPLTGDDLDVDTD